MFGYEFSTLDIPIFFTLLFLEGVLSFDNAAILAAMVRKLPEKQRRKALLYGLVGAYVFRTLAIVSVAFIIANPFLRVLGGAYLVYLAVKHFARLRKPPAAQKPHMAWLTTRLGLSSFWGVVIAVELADIAFALDQVLVAVALTPKIPLIIAASLVAILFLRLSAIYMARLMDWFPRLESLAYAAVGFVGLKLLSEELAHYLGYEAFHVPKAVSVGVTLSLLAVPTLTKFLLERLRRHHTPQ